MPSNTTYLGSVKENFQFTFIFRNDDVKYQSPRAPSIYASGKKNLYSDKIFEGNRKKTAENGGNGNDVRGRGMNRFTDPAFFG